MTDLVDQMFPPINRKTAPAYTDFNFWRTPVTQFELPDFPPASPALSARSDTSRLGLKRLGSLVPSLSRRSSRSTLVPGKSTATGTPSSPLLQATLVEEPNGMSEDEDFDRSESSSMPGSLPNDSDFESRYRAAQKARGTAADDYRDEVQARDEGEEEVAQEEEGDEFGEELDFSSVPVRSSAHHYAGLMLMIRRCSISNIATIYARFVVIYVYFRSFPSLVPQRD